MNDQIQPDQIFGTAGAAIYLNIAHPTVKYHIYVAKNLKADMEIGGRLIFFKSTLDLFNSNKRSQGRPKKTESVESIDYTQENDYTQDESEES